MIDLTIRTDIARPVQDVFAYVTDPAKLPSWQTNTVSVEQEGEGPLPIHARIAFAPSATGTQMEFTAHGQPAGAMRLAQPLLRVALRRQFASHCATLKRVMEDQSPGQGA